MEITTYYFQITGRREGFTMLELALVLVIMGFIIIGITQGQKLYYNAKINRIISDMKDYRHYFLLYYDTYGMYPGDEDDPNFPSGDTLNGNHNGLIDTAEANNVWEDLFHALGAVRKNSAVRGGQYIFGNRDFGFGIRNYIGVTNIINNMAQAIDKKYDDGVYNTGNIQAKTNYTNPEALNTLYWRI
ncbi:MAG: hypothetical protein LWW94_05760 [Candidatus Desulfofervidaceae bacterium]|nr:hypothetical protein [Candidatus Desulfofervidaceae bacterium]